MWFFSSACSVWCNSRVAEKENGRGNRRLPWGKLKGGETMDNGQKTLDNGQLAGCLCPLNKVNLNCHGYIFEYFSIKHFSYLLCPIL